MAKIIVRSVADHPPLAVWLEKLRADLVWAYDGRELGAGSTPTVQCWRIGAGIAYVILRGGGGVGCVPSWDIATTLDSTDIKQTLIDAEARLDLLSVVIKDKNGDTHAKRINNTSRETLHATACALIDELGLTDDSTGRETFLVGHVAQRDVGAARLIKSSEWRGVFWLHSDGTTTEAA